MQWNQWNPPFFSDQTWTPIIFFQIQSHQKTITNPSKQTSLDFTRQPRRAWFRPARARSAWPGHGEAPASVGLAGWPSRRRAGEVSNGYRYPIGRIRVKLSNILLPILCLRILMNIVIQQFELLYIYIYIILYYIILYYIILYYIILYYIILYYIILYYIIYPKCVKS